MQKAFNYIATFLIGALGSLVIVYFLVLPRYGNPDRIPSVQETYDDLPDDNKDNSREVDYNYSSDSDGSIDELEYDQNTSAEEYDGWKEYKSKKYGIKFMYPGVNYKVNSLVNSIEIESSVDNLGPNQTYRIRIEPFVSEAMEMIFENSLEAKVIIDDKVYNTYTYESGDGGEFGSSMSTFTYIEFGDLLITEENMKETILVDGEERTFESTQEEVENGNLIIQSIERI